MLMPDVGLLSVGGTALCMCMVLSAKERTRKRTLTCRKCGETRMRAKDGRIICRNGHRVTSSEQAGHA